MALFSLGFVHAQDRLFQMDNLRRISTGRLSEIYGEKPLQLDIVMRSLGIAEACIASEQVLSDRDRRDLSAYRDGVNSYVERYGTPIEYMILGITWEHWTIADTIAVEKLMDLSLTSDFYTEFAREELINIAGPEFTEMVYPHRV